MCRRTLLTVSVFCLSGGIISAMDETTILRPSAQWMGRHADVELRKAAPQAGFIRDSASWKTLWQAWRPGEDVPEVDFTKDLVLVETADGPNRVIIIPRLDQNGHIRYVNQGTRAAGGGFGYAMLQVPREGIITVNGVSVETGRPADAEYIKVEVKGKLRTGIFAIGGETTGTTISAQGLTWELDFGDNKALREQATKLNGQTAIVKGTLEVRPGVEIRERWIVTVGSLQGADD